MKSGFGKRLVRSEEKKTYRQQSAYFIWAVHANFKNIYFY
jgi:hypothetical protein